MARYEHREGEGKFWEITRKGRAITTRAGKIGAGAARDRDGVLHLYDRRGRTTNREFSDDAAATKHYDKMVAEKLREGYVLVDGVDAAPIAPIEMHVNAELEDAIAAAPDDPTSYLVYADWLIARGDPRGELITMQHGMRAQRDPATFMTFKKQEEALRTAHLRSWLGDIAGTAVHRLKLEWRWGVFEAVQVDRPEHPSEVTLAALVDALLACPLAHFIRRLALRGPVDALAAAVPETPPRTLAKLSLLVEDTASRAPLELACERYRAAGVDAGWSRYESPDRYVPRRE